MYDAVPFQTDHQNRATVASGGAESDLQSFGSHPAVLIRGDRSQTPPAEAQQPDLVRVAFDDDHLHDAHALVERDLVVGLIPRRPDFEDGVGAGIHIATGGPQQILASGPQEEPLRNPVVLVRAVPVPDAQTEVNHAEPVSPAIGAEKFKQVAGDALMLEIRRRHHMINPLPNLIATVEPALAALVDHAVRHIQQYGLHDGIVAARPA